MEIQPGDLLEINCTYSTVSALGPIFHGLTASDEMCAMSLLVYPYDINVPYQCFQCQGGYGACYGARYGASPQPTGNYSKCPDKKRYNRALFDKIHDALIPFCDSEGVTCFKGCQNHIEDVIAEEECLQGGIGMLTRKTFASKWGLQVNNMLISCSGNGKISTKQKQDIETKNENINILNTEQGKLINNSPKSCVFDNKKDSTLSVIQDQTYRDSRGWVGSDDANFKIAWGKNDADIDWWKTMASSGKHYGGDIYVILLLVIFIEGL